ncbi:MAG: outer membrane protein assembly factor BamA [Enterobacteriaceae bacterium]|nr:outer membrane protein assembly factor BamA [Enterobacteriaceae bacterium]
MNYNFFLSTLFVLNFCLNGVFLFAKDFLVENVNISGLYFTSEKDVIYMLQSELKSRNATEDGIVNCLYASGFYDSITISSNNLDLNVILKERQHISDIKVYGDKNKNYIDFILNENNIKIGERYNFFFLELFRQNLEQYYINNGRHDVIVDIRLKFSICSKFVDISINVYKHKAQKIKEIKVLGNEAFRENKILSLLSHSKTNWMSWFSNDDNYIKGKLIVDLEDLRAYYLDRGYIHFRVDSVRSFFSHDKKGISILLTLREGKKYKIGDINFVCDDVFLIEKVKNIVNSHINIDDIFCNRKLLNAKRSVKDYLVSINYINSTVDIGLTDTGKDEIIIEFSFNKPSKLMVKSISFVGNFLTSDDVLRRYVPQIEGSFVSYDEINFGREEIIRNGLASNVSIEYAYDFIDNKKVDVVYKIDEQKTTKFLIGCSYSYGDGLVLSIGSELSNFLGSGRDIIFNINSNKLQSEYTFGYFDPYFTHTGIGVGYNVNYKFEQLGKNSGNFDHASSTFGASLYYSFKVGKYKKISFGFGCDMTRLKMYEDAAPIEVKDFVSKEGLDFKEYYFNFVFTYNSLDKFIFPNYGIYQHLSAKVSIPGSSIRYYVLNYDLNYYRQLSCDYVFNITSYLGYGNKYSSTSSYPFFKNFFIRGINNVRGFKDKTLGPRDSNGENFGGNFLINVKMSLFFPVPIFYDERTIRTSIFIDSGQVYNTITEKKHKNDKFLQVSASLRYSIGLSFIWNTSFGIPFELSVAYPLNIKKTDKRSIFYFNLGMQMA